MKRIITYNVNGIRAAVKKELINWLKAAKPDVLCIQETKAQLSQIPVELFEELGYHHYWFSAEKKGYSGVGILCLEEPNHIEYGMGIEKYDREGRMLRVDFDNYSVISVYHPSGSSGEVRQQFKMEWLDDFHSYIHELNKEKENLIVCGDYNICHQAIDIHDPKRNAKSSGFLPEEREWIGSFIDSGFVDSFRLINPNPHHYTWWSYRANARNNNKGWRIDYNMVSQNLETKIENAFILPDAKQSDHCPCGVDMDL